MLDFEYRQCFEWYEIMSAPIMTAPVMSAPPVMTALG